uniref:Cysteine-rich protein 3 n=1 Tax=Cyprinus carpio TaxID=7962 RepID=A0A8C1G237_CYPCA
MFAGETYLCPGCGKAVYFAEKVMSLGRNWHRPCLRCVRCKKTLTPGGHAEHEGSPYCHVPCYGYLFGPKGELFIFRIECAHNLSGPHWVHLLSFSPHPPACHDL